MAVLHRRVFKAAVVALGLGWGAPALAQPVVDDQCELHYRIVLRYDATPRRLDISVGFPAQGRSQTYLRVQPSWAGVDGFAAALTAWSGSDGATQVARVDQPNRLRVDHPTTGRIEVRFQAAPSLADPDDGKPQDDLEQYKTQIGANWFRFFGYGALPSVEPWGDDRRNVEMCVTVAQPGLPDAPVFGSHFDDRGEEITRQFRGSPSLLRHAFYAGGTGWRLVERPLTGGTLHLAFRGRYGAADAAFADRAASLVETHRRFWGDTTASSQWIVVNPNFTPFDTGGTVVHRVAVVFANTTFSPASDRFESLIGHENLHEWIPQRLGASGADASHYWLSEGFTDYYTHRLLLASGVWTLQQYARSLTSQLRAYRLSPARNDGARSIAARFFTDRDAGRQMYLRGELLAMRWDMALRDRGKPGLDDVLRGIFLPLGADAQTGPYATERVLDALAPLLGPRPRQDVAEIIDKGSDAALPVDLFGPCFTLQWMDVHRWVLGFDPEALKLRKATGVSVDGPAHRAGLRDGMELSDWSIHGTDPGRDVVLTVVVDSVKKSLRYKPVDGSTDRLPLVVVAADAGADAACEQWIRRPKRLK